MVVMPCCNPAHLYAGTQADNVRDMQTHGAFGKTCAAGHRWDVVGYYQYEGNKRRCKKCSSNDGKRYRNKVRMMRAGKSK